MIDHFLSQLNILSIVVAFGYALFIYGVVEIMKNLTKTKPFLVRLWPVFPGVIGAISGPFVLPYLSRLIYEGPVMPVQVSIMLGVGVGAIASNIYSFVKHTVRRGVASVEGGPGVECYAGNAGVCSEMGGVGGEVSVNSVKVANGEDGE